MAKKGGKVKIQKKKTKSQPTKLHTFKRNKLSFEERIVNHLVDIECDKGYIPYTNLISMGLSFLPKRA